MNRAIEFPDDNGLDPPGLNVCPEVFEPGPRNAGPEGGRIGVMGGADQLPAALPDEPLTVPTLALKAGGLLAETGGREPEVDCCSHTLGIGTHLGSGNTTDRVAAKEYLS